MSRQNQTRWSIDTIRSLFKRYYEKRSVRPPEEIERREFAFQLFEMESYARHIAFRDAQAFLNYLAEKAPRHVYYSIALYHLPDARRMEEKGWIGSEIMIDIDVDHLDRCSNLTHDDCLAEGLREALLAKKILERDFGMVTEAYFSGSRGFHILARGEDYMTLGREEREEIAKYLMAADLDVELLFPRKRATPPSKDDPGWRGWLALKGEAINHTRGALTGVGVKIDSQVTRDPSRLARPIGSINGKSGLMVVEIDSFRPDLSLSPFSGELTVRAKRPVNDVILSEQVLLREGETATLEAPVAILLYLKGYADILGGDVKVV